MHRRTRLVAAAVVVAGLVVGAVLALGLGSASSPRAARLLQGARTPQAARIPHGNDVPPGFVGTMAVGPVLGHGVDLGHQLDVMVNSGVESLRVVIDWSATQPYKSMSQVPGPRTSEFQNVGGVPTRFTDIDRIVNSAAERGLSLLPVVEYAPAWDALHPGSFASPPASPAPYANFVGALIRRYGPTGTYWTAHPRVPRVPIGMWQIWNEPDFPTYWSEQPFAPRYVSLLRATHAAIKAADPQAKLVLAGLPNFSWEYLAEIYKVPGSQKLFDVVAIHPYTAQPNGVIVILNKVRAVMNHAGDSSKPIVVTELSWPSSLGKSPQKFGNETTEAGQKSKLAAVIPLLARYRSPLGLMGFYYYTWMGDEGQSAGSFDYAGLFKYVDGRVSAKPAFSVFVRGALAIEGCRRKARIASSCL